MPQHLLIKIVAGGDAVFEDGPVGGGFDFFLGFVDGEGADVVSLCSVDLDPDDFRNLIVAVVDAETAVKVLRAGNVGVGEHRALGKPKILHTLQGEDGLAVVGIVGLRYKVPSPLPSFQKIWYDREMLPGLFVE